MKVARLAINRIHEVEYLRTVPIAGVIEPVEPTAAPSKTSKVAAKPEMTDTKAAGSKLKPIGKGSKGGSEKPTPKVKPKVAEK